MTVRRQELSTRWNIPMTLKVPSLLVVMNWDRNGDDLRYYLN